MSAGDGLRLFMIAAGVLFWAMAVVSLARKRMTEAFCIAWSVAAALLVCGGIILRPAGWSTYVSWGGLLLAIFGTVFLLAGAFFFSERVSVLARQVKELAIQVSLLHQENEAILRGRSGDTEESEAAENEDDPVRHQHTGPGRGGDGPDGASAAAGPGAV